VHRVLLAEIEETFFSVLKRFTIHDFMDRNWQLRSVLFVAPRLSDNTEKPTEYLGNIGDHLGRSYIRPQYAMCGTVGAVSNALIRRWNLPANWSFHAVERGSFAARIA